MQPQPHLVEHARACEVAGQLAAAVGQQASLRAGPSTRPTAAAGSEPRSCAFQLSGPESVRDATNFGIGLTRSAYAPVLPGQYAERTS
jgi:hypothetical protein